MCEPTLESRERTAARVEEETGAALIHPFNDLRIIRLSSLIVRSLQPNHQDQILQLSQRLWDILFPCCVPILSAMVYELRWVTLHVHYQCKHGIAQSAQGY